MPKMKTKSGAKKRFKFLGSGAIKRTKSHLQHSLTKKTTKQKRHLLEKIRHNRNTCFDHLINNYD